MSEQGIAALSSALITAGGFIGKIQRSLQDGKISFIEGIDLGMNVAEFIRVVQRWPEIKAEFKDLDAQEREQIKQIFAEELDLENEETEEIVERTFNLLMEISAVIGLFGTAKKRNR